MITFAKSFILNNEQQVVFRIEKYNDSNTYDIVSETYLGEEFCQIATQMDSKEHAQEVFAGLTDLNAAEFYNAMYETLEAETEEPTTNLDRL
jgi:hypothetical protein